MAFPATTPADGSRRDEDNVPYIVRNQRWEKLATPNVVQAGAGGGEFDFADRDWVRIHWDTTQVGQPICLVKITAAMIPKVDCDIDVGFTSTSEGGHMLNSFYDTNRSYGLVNWGDSGQQKLDWSSGNAFNHNGFWLVDTNKTDRLSGGGYQQMLEMTLTRWSATESVVSWVFRTQAQAYNGLAIQHYGNIVVKKNIGDITGMFLRSGPSGGATFRSGRAVVEVY